MISIAKPIIGDEEITAVLEVLRSGMVVQGTQVASFEEDVTQRLGVKGAVAVNSGTAALHTALHAAGIGPGDEVITTPFSFIATANAILMCGAAPVFADIDPETFNLSPARVSEAITPKTKAILGVHLFGHPFDPEINKLAEENNLLLFEDACQAIGATQEGQPCGALGAAAAFSFYATKNVMSAEGGMVTTNDSVLAEKARRFRHHGQGTERYRYDELGYNYRMTDIHAAIGRCQLRHLDEWTATRQEHAALLSKGLKTVPGIVLPTVASWATHCYHQYTIRVTEAFPLSRAALIEHLKKEGIGSAIFYPTPLHLEKHLPGKEGDFPEAERAAREVLSLPVHPSLQHEDIEKIIEVMRGCS